MARFPLKTSPLRKTTLAPARRRELRLDQLVREVIAELKKAEWPTREQAVRLTFLVIGLSLFVGFLLGAVDFGFARVFAFLFGG